MNDKTVFVVGVDGAVEHMFRMRGYKLANEPEEASVLCFTGGADVSPMLYGEMPIEQTYADSIRDTEEIAVLRETEHCREAGTQIAVGICRGGQLLNVMAGGSMWQHVNNHTRSHEAVDFLTRKTVVVTSTHHQMMRPLMVGTTHVLMRAGESTRKVGHKEKSYIHEPKTLAVLDDVEAVWYDEHKFLCFQPHPEYADNGCRQAFFDYIDWALAEE